MWRHQIGNQNSYIEKGQTLQWPTEKVQKDRHYNGQQKKYKRTNNDLQNTHIKLKIENTGGEHYKSNAASCQLHTGISSAFDRTFLLIPEQFKKSRKWKKTFTLHSVNFHCYMSNNLRVLQKWKQFRSNMSFWQYPVSAIHYIKQLYGQFYTK